MADLVSTYPSPFFEAIELPDGPQRMFIRKNDVIAIVESTYSHLPGYIAIRFHMRSGATFDGQVPESAFR